MEELCRPRRPHNVINVKTDGFQYDLANVLMLAFPYGYPKVMSSYKYAGHDQGPPGNPVHTSGNVNCFGSDWECEHRFRPIADMVAFRKQTLPASTAFEGKCIKRDESNPAKDLVWEPDPNNLAATGATMERKHHERGNHENRRTPGRPGLFFPCLGAKREYSQGARAGWRSLGPSGC